MGETSSGCFADPRVSLRQQVCKMGKHKKHKFKDTSKEIFQECMQANGEEKPKLSDDIDVMSKHKSAESNIDNSQIVSKKKHKKKKRKIDESIGDDLSTSVEEFVSSSKKSKRRDDDGKLDEANCTEELMKGTSKHVQKKHK